MSRFLSFPIHIWSGEMSLAETDVRLITFSLQLLCTIAAAAIVYALSRLLHLQVPRIWNSTSCGPVQLKTNAVKGWPLVGMVPEILQNHHRIHDWLVSQFDERHTFTAVMVAGQECYFTADVENVKHILKTNFDNYIKGGLFHDRFKILLGDGIFNVDGEQWKQQRRTVMPEFTSRNLREFYAAAYTEVALKVSCLLNEICQQGVPIDLQDLFYRMTLEAIGNVGFGVEIGCLPSKFPLPDNAFANAFDSASDIVIRRFFNPLWKLKRFLNVGCEAELVQHIEVVDSFTYGVIAQRKLEMAAYRNQQAAGVPPEAPKLDIITRFLKLADDEKNGVDCKLIRDICLNFVIAGRDSTAVTLSWLVYALMKNPDIAQRLYEELRDFESRNMPHESKDIGGPDAKTGGVDEEFREFMELLTQASLKTDLPYLAAVISETLRLFPAVPQVPKGIKDDDVLPDGTRVRKGMIITFSPYGMGRMTRIWGPDAKEFKPERWLQDGKLVTESEFKLSAFQAGSRMCMGRDSAHTQIKLTAGILFRFFEFELVKGHAVEYRVLVTLAMANGLKVNVRRREATRGGNGGQRS